MQEIRFYVHSSHPAQVCKCQQHTIQGHAHNMRTMSIHVICTHVGPQLTRPFIVMMLDILCIASPDMLTSPRSEFKANTTRPAQPMATDPVLQSAMLHMLTHSFSSLVLSAPTGTGLESEKLNSLNPDVKCLSADNCKCLFALIANIFAEVCTCPIAP